MKHAKQIIYESRPYGEAAFPIVVGFMYWLIRLACTAAFQALAGR
jgi:hypothetical protein